MSGIEKIVLSWETSLYLMNSAAVLYFVFIYSFHDPLPQKYHVTVQSKQLFKLQLELVYSLQKKITGWYV